MLEYYAHIVQEDLLVLNHYKMIFKVFIKGFKEIRICRAMDQLPRRPFIEDVKHIFYCK